MSWLFLHSLRRTGKKAWEVLGSFLDFSAQGLPFRCSTVIYATRFSFVLQHQGPQSQPLRFPTRPRVLQAHITHRLALFGWFGIFGPCPCLETICMFFLFFYFAKYVMVCLLGEWLFTVLITLVLYRRIRTQQCLFNDIKC